MCLCHFYGIVCNWNLCVYVAKISFFYGFSCIVQSGIKEFVLFGCLRCVWISNSGFKVFCLFDHYFLALLIGN